MVNIEPKKEKLRTNLDVELEYIYPQYPWQEREEKYYHSILISCYADQEGIGLVAIDCKHKYIKKIIYTVKQDIFFPRLSFQSVIDVLESYAKQNEDFLSTSFITNKKSQITRIKNLPTIIHYESMEFIEELDIKEALFTLSCYQNDGQLNWNENTYEQMKNLVENEVNHIAFATLYGISWLHENATRYYNAMLDSHYDKESD